MKNLNLNAYGVEVLSQQEMLDNNGGIQLGGSVYRVITKLLEVIGVLEVLDAVGESFLEGVQEGYNDQQKK
ncbi:MAG: hypothetical protein LBB85_07440 [Dysgonamonadaceae bacterium]|jgi:hypothetical protein|nr:hypothetical protein [Dysgonamonadaceae bacterium]